MNIKFEVYNATRFDGTEYHDVTVTDSGSYVYSRRGEGRVKNQNQFLQLIEELMAEMLRNGVYE